MAATCSELQFGLSLTNRYTSVYNGTTRYRQFTAKYRQFTANRINYRLFINGIADLGLRFLGALEQGDGVNGAGHVVKMEDESGYARYSYDVMGNVSENCRTFALAAEDNAYTFIMNTEYDTWGRLIH